MEGRGGNRNQNLADVLYGITQKADYPCETTADPKQKKPERKQRMQLGGKQYHNKKMCSKKPLTVQLVERELAQHNTVSRTHMKQRGKGNRKGKQQHEKAAGNLCIDDQKKSQGKSNPSRLWHFLAAAWQTRLVSIYRPAA